MTEPRRPGDGGPATAVDRLLEANTRAASAARETPGFDLAPPKHVQHAGH
jgi:hypothetical protein